jgi:hypothetical protein
MGGKLKKVMWMLRLYDRASVREAWIGWRCGNSLFDSVTKCGEGGSDPHENPAGLLIGAAADSSNCQRSGESSTHTKICLAILLDNGSARYGARCSRLPTITWLCNGIGVSVMLIGCADRTSHCWLTASTYHPIPNPSYLKSSIGWLNRELRCIEQRSEQAYIYDVSIQKFTSDFIMENQPNHSDYLGIFLWVIFRRPCERECFSRLANNPHHHYG